MQRDERVHRVRPGRGVHARPPRERAALALAGAPSRTRPPTSRRTCDAGRASARRRQRTRHDHDRPRPAGASRPGHRRRRLGRRRRAGGGPRRERTASANVEFRVGDAYALEFADDTFDVVHAHQVLQHLARPVDALREFRRVAEARRRRSPCATSTTAASSGARASAGLDRWLDAVPRRRDWNGGEPDAGRHLKRWAREAGFADLEATGVDLGVLDRARTRVVGRLVGRARARSRSSPRTRSSRALEPRRARSASPRRGASGRPTTTAGCSCRTARCSRRA